MKIEVSWVKDIKPAIKIFLNKMSNNDYSYFKYSYSGDLFDISERWGLGNIVFATKILFITGLLDELESVYVNNLYKGIIKFSDFNGYIHDPKVTYLPLKDKIYNYIQRTDMNNNKDIENTMRAETRQSFVALSLLNKRPQKAFRFIPYSENGIEDYLSSFNWQFPWHAGSHFSHLLFFLNMNSKLFHYKQEEYKTLIAFSCNWISKLQSKDNGCWYSGDNTSLSEKINGALKVLTGLHAADIYDFPYPEKLIDTALAGINDSEACSNFNISYVLYSANKICPKYRKTEIEDFLLNRVNIYKDFYFPEYGGFSFHIGKANDVYYGRKITKGKPEPDIHGTAMFVLGLAIINSVINLGLEWKVPLN
ncbi:MAG: hypothetical protein V1874_12270 [Spirochaetota bacterium]